jgi:mannonate dehydratase
MRRRHFLATVGAGALGFALYRSWPDQGLLNPCLSRPLPAELANHDLVQAAWEGVDPTRMWDCHVHVAGVGDGGSGVWLTPNTDSPLHPLEFLQKRFYLNAACADRPGAVDEAYVTRLLELQADLRPGGRLMLLAFDYFHDVAGKRVLERSAFHAPDAYAQRLAARYPDRLEWIASIHPYRADAVEALTQAARAGARAVKWLPSAMGIDPASPRCDRFYEALVRLRLPLLSHGGAEVAVHGGAEEQLNNPLRLRRPLDHGVTVVVAHSASLGSDVDLDRGPAGPSVESFELFARLMDDHRYEGRLYGDLAALGQVNRMGRPLRVLLERQDWHSRLLNGSDYPLPAVMPLFSLASLVAAGFVTEAEAEVLSAVRRYNPLLFDFALKRRIQVGGKRFGPAVFHTRHLFARA